ncbi:acetoacetate--CoA ligase [Sporichthya polymorpha]|uniref:acetoacetate--CoA ligase n=1 Tax=Sporichthya polymorpha TaxID=35751 RepID=UPI000365A1FE|nr:acetoacetate--CoA ligase [Sporichthya polymorpha]
MSQVTSPAAANDLGPVLWQASPERAAASTMARFLTWLSEREGRNFPDHDSMWAWSVEETDRFWAAMWDFVDMRSPTPWTAVREGDTMPGVRWFPGASVNFAERCLRPGTDDDPALICLKEPAAGGQLEPRTVTRGELRRDVAALGAWLRSVGVRPGDRVAAYLPNIEHAVISCMAAASVGAVWALLSPDFGSEGTIARLSQLEPTVLIAGDGYHWQGRTIDRRDVAVELAASLPTVRQVVQVSYAFPGEPLPAYAADGPAVTAWADAVAAAAPLEFEQTDFSHPLWVLFTSGTTGMPKGLVHGHGGILMEGLKWAHLYADLGPGDTYFTYTTTGWMLWNSQLLGLAAGSTIVLYEGSPGYPDFGVLWEAAGLVRAKVFFLGAALVTATQNAGVVPKERADLSCVQTIQVSGSALPTAGYPWVYENVSADVRLDSTSGGTDICGAFVGGNDLLPVRAGRISGPLAGAAIAAWDDDGNPVTGEVGELVITRPMPSMPLHLWNDTDNARYLDSYFDPWPGVWRHGDWITLYEDNSVVIHGRSDATLNRDGVRLGSSDFYGVLEAMPQIQETLVLGVEQPGGGYYLPLFVVPAPGYELDDELIAAIRTELRTKRTPRHVPDEIIAAPAIPHTLTGKRLEVPIKRLLQGVPLEKAANLAAVDDPAVVRWFAEFARSRLAGT